MMFVACEYSVVLIISERKLFNKTLRDEHNIPCPNCGNSIAVERYCSSCGTPNPINYIDESVKVSKTKVIRRQEKKQAPRRAIVVGISVTLAVLLGTSYANAYALSNMQYRVADVSMFDYATLSSDVTLEACNPTAFPAGFDRFSAIVNYKQGEFARIVVAGGTAMPYQASNFDGELKLSAQTNIGLLIALADAVGGKDSPYNENDITLKVTMDANILGIIPHSQTKEFAFAEFQQYMSAQQADRYLCG